MLVFKKKSIGWFFVQGDLICIIGSYRSANFHQNVLFLPRSQIVTESKAHIQLLLYETNVFFIIM